MAGLAPVADLTPVAGLAPVAGLVAVVGVGGTGEVLRLRPGLAAVAGLALVADLTLVAGLVAVVGVGGTGEALPLRLGSTGALEGSLAPGLPLGGLAVVPLSGLVGGRPAGVRFGNRAVRAADPIGRFAVIHVLLEGLRVLRSLDTAEVDATGARVDPLLPGGLRPFLVPKLSARQRPVRVADLRDPGSGDSIGPSEPSGTLGGAGAPLLIRTTHLDVDEKEEHADEQEEPAEDESRNEPGRRDPAGPGQ